ncbi:MAG: hypothetical protein DRH26_16165 [Deltaproteobacteria bacterium]|nr:MAG: hypothetical protein DRH26_16165 [Deltaproteobacteria bacterium]
MSNLFLLHDDRVNCWSLIAEMTIERYLNLVKPAYREKGGLDNQRAPLKTKTAIRIRRIMVRDIQSGAILPPVVVGAIINNEISGKVLSCKNIDEILDFLNSDEIPISIIDGMQRTTAIKEAADKDEALLKRKIRVEFWLSEAVNNLIYRMLILNTGQIPWEMTRQLDTIYSSLTDEIIKKVPNIDVYTKDNTARRKGGGQYQSSHLIELFLIFSSRKLEINTKERIAQDFARADAIESTSNDKFIDYFVNVLYWMAELDKAISEYSPDQTDENITDWKIVNGRDLFSGAPARIGFIANAAIWIFDEPGFDRSDSDIIKKVKEFETAMKEIVDKIKQLRSNDLHEYLDFMTLNQKLSAKTGKIGEYERRLYMTSFNSMLKNASRLPNLTPCWNAR